MEWCAAYLFSIKGQEQGMDTIMELASDDR